MSLTTITLLVLALYLVQLFLQETSRFGFDLRGIVGNRDALPDLSPIAGRLERAKNNMLEALPLYLGLVLLVHMSGVDPVAPRRAALVFLLARVAYVPAYVSGIPMLRSAAWLTGVAGLFMMAMSVR
jgi:uncharacterized MAPEG superfamily protein